MTTAMHDNKCIPLPYSSGQSGKNASPSHQSLPTSCCSYSKGMRDQWSNDEGKQQMSTSPSPPRVFLTCWCRNDVKLGIPMIKSWSELRSMLCGDSVLKRARDVSCGVTPAPKTTKTTKTGGLKQTNKNKSLKQETTRKTLKKEHRLEYGSTLYHSYYMCLLLGYHAVTIRSELTSMLCGDSMLNRVRDVPCVPPPYITYICWIGVGWQRNCQTCRSLR